MTLDLAKVIEETKAEEKKPKEIMLTRCYTCSSEFDQERFLHCPRCERAHLRRHSYGGRTGPK